MSEPELDQPEFGSVEEYVSQLKGDRPINKLLIANNGIAAVKCIRYIRRWAYDMFANERQIKFVVMATPDDLKANAEFTRMADDIVEVPGGSNNNNYANVTLIIDIAERYQVDAVWAGWGHASENPLLPDGLAKTARKIVFIGPTGKPMRALGDKIGSTIIAQSAKVPTIAWNGDGVTVDYAKLGEIPAEIYKKGQIFTAQDCIDACKRIGYPVMIKASEGGGGKGIRKVMNEEEVPAAFRQVQGELPGSPIFVMRLAARSRHLEVQLLADKHGDAIALQGRDCSVQRRHQKIIEEGPQLAAEQPTWLEMMAAAVRLSKEVDYCNAGTVEYLYSEETKGFYFLELNPRLQVEHPVTEMIMKVNMPAAQLQVAMGIPLGNIPDIRDLYGYPRFGNVGKVDLSIERQRPTHGHVIATRITAENPDAGFQPTSGEIVELNFRSTPDVWGYFSLDSHGQVHEFADSQFGHVFAWGATRKIACKNSVLALKELSIRGEIRTTVEYIIKMIQSDDFHNNHISTSWLDGRIARHKEIMLETQMDPRLVVTCGAVVQAHKQLAQRVVDYTDSIERGQLPPPELLSPTVKLQLIFNDTKYKLQVDQTGPISFTLHCNGRSQHVDVRSVNDGGYLVLIEGQSHLAYMSQEAGALRLVLNGQTNMFMDEYDPTRICANTAGKLIQFLVEDGEHVDKGSPYAEIEVMKMLMPLLAPESGTLSHVKPEGAVLNAGDLIARLSLDDPSCVILSKDFEGSLVVDDSASADDSGARPHFVMKRAVVALQRALEGYCVPSAEQELALQTMLAQLKNKQVPVYELEEALFVLSGRIDGTLFEGLSGMTAAWWEKNGKDAAKGSLPETEAFDTLSFKKLITDYAAAAPEGEKMKFATTIADLVTVCDAYLEGLHGKETLIVSSLLKSYYDVESLFVGKTREDTEMELRVLHKDDLQVVYRTMRSHQLIKQKNNMCLLLLKHFAACLESSDSSSASSSAALKLADTRYALLLQNIASLVGLQFAAIAQPARQLLNRMRTGSLSAAKTEFIELCRTAVAAGPPGSKERAMSLLAPGVGDAVRSALTAVLQDFLVDEPAELRAAALEGYVMRLYRAYKTEKLQVALPAEEGGVLAVHWTFRGQDDTHVADVPMSRQDSYNNLAAMGQPPSPRTAGGAASGGSTSDSDVEEELISADVLRHGVIACFDTFAQLKVGFEKTLALMPVVKKGLSIASRPEPVNVLHLCVSKKDDSLNFDDVSLDEQLRVYLASQNEQGLIASRGIRRITFTLAADCHCTLPHQLLKPRSALMYTYRASIAFREDQLVRHIEAPMAFQLELRRLGLFNIKLVPAGTRGVHLYRATAKKSAIAAAGVRGELAHRYFVRSITRSTEGGTAWLDTAFLEALGALEVAIGADQSGDGVESKSNNIFLNIVSVTDVDLESVSSTISQMIEQHTRDVLRLNVQIIEIKISARFSPQAPKVTVRFVVTNPTGFVMRVEAYVEAKEPSSGQTVLSAIGGAGDSCLDGYPVATPYSVVEDFERNRQYASASTDTLYCYDFLELFEKGIVEAWDAAKSSAASSSSGEWSQLRVPKRNMMLEHKELVLVPRAGVSKNWTVEDDPELTQVIRPPGKNDIGMVAWLITMRTPEYPNGRQMVVIANDISFKAGSFGTREDLLFQKASQLARERGLPRIYLAANSGARIGLAEEVKAKFRVAWHDPADQSKGFKYLYLTSADYQALLALGSINADKLVDDASGEERWRIRDVIGSAGADLGVENLRGSGMIAGETSRAYDETFTLTLVTGRTVGIGAYLVRLGHRCIQKNDGAPIILTGFSALNKLMGRGVYTSNNQIGGIKIMHSNGISHTTATDHMDSVRQMLLWMSYIPAQKGDPLPVLQNGVDANPTRALGFVPGKQPYDPRILIEGCSYAIAQECGFSMGGSAGAGEWLDGFCDRGSFTEYLAGWAKTVCVGRARLGGIPLGMIVTELRTVEQLTPADPAAPTSEERVVQQAGQVWFPDSAHKTAQSIKDFSKEGLPIMVMSNWRGFSGGQRDMFDEVLKFGALIVDALVGCTMPVFVYIPPFAELRGGAWVVIDPTINPDCMEMYADPYGRGGVLEPSGTVSVKFRAADLVKTAHRLDATLQGLDKELAAEGLGDEQRKALGARVKAREASLMNVYLQVAEHFADLHDTPGRMQRKGVIRKVVAWKEARNFFYWRLRRRLKEEDLCKQIDKASGGMPVRRSKALLRTWFSQASKEREEEESASSSGPGGGLTAQLLQMVGATSPHKATASAPAKNDEWENDRAVLAWMGEEAETIKDSIASLKGKRVSRQVAELGLEDPEAAVEGILGMLGQLSPAQRENAILTLRKGVIFDSQIGS